MVKRGKKNPDEQDSNVFVPLNILHRNSEVCVYDGQMKSRIDNLNGEIILHLKDPEYLIVLRALKAATAVGARLPHFARRVCAMARIRRDLSARGKIHGLHHTFPSVHIFSKSTSFR